MRPEHLEANRLVDIAETGNKAACEAAEQELQARGPDHLHREAVRLPNMQYQMYRRYNRLFGWRADWINGGRERDNQ